LQYVIIFSQGKNGWNGRRAERRKGGKNGDFRVIKGRKSKRSEYFGYAQHEDPAMQRSHKAGGRRAERREKGDLGVKKARSMG